MRYVSTIRKPCSSPLRYTTLARHVPLKVTVRLMPLHKFALRKGAFARRLRALRKPSSSSTVSSWAFPYPFIRFYACAVSKSTHSFSLVQGSKTARHAKPSPCLVHAYYRSFGIAEICIYFLVLEHICLWTSLCHSRVGSCPSSDSS